MKIKNMEKRVILRFVSVIVGIIIWFMIVYTENASIDANLRGIPVQVTGESTLMTNSLVLVNKDDIGNASLAVRGKRGDIIKAMGNITAVADVSKITSPGTYDIKVSYELNTNALYITNIKTADVKLVVEKAVTKEFDVEVINGGSTSDDLVIESIPDAAKITVAGAAADIDKIAHAAVFVDVTDMTENTVSDYQVKLVDDQLRELEFDNEILAEYENIKVTSVIYQKAILPIKVYFPDKYNDEYVFETTYQSKKDIAVGIDDETEVSEIKAVIDEDEFDIEKEEYTVKLQEEEGVYIPSEEKVKIRIKAIPIVEKEITVGLEVKGNERQYEAAEKINIKVRGGESYITEENITASIDIEKLKSGSHNVKVDVEFSKDGLSLAEEVYTIVNVL